MGTDEQEKKPKAEKKDPMKALMPFLGVILLVAFGLIAFGVREEAHRILVEDVKIDGFPITAEAARTDSEKEDAEMTSYLVAIVIFVLEILIAGAVYALFAPKPAIRVSEGDLKSEKRDMEKEVLLRKKRRRQMKEEALKGGKDFRDV